MNVLRQHLCVSIGIAAVSSRVFRCPRHGSSLERHSIQHTKPRRSLNPSSFYPSSPFFVFFFENHATRETCLRSKVARGAPAQSAAFVGVFTRSRYALGPSHFCAVVGNGSGCVMARVDVAFGMNCCLCALPGRGKSSGSCAGTLMLDTTAVYTQQSTTSVTPQ